MKENKEKMSSMENWSANSLEIRLLKKNLLI